MSSSANAISGSISASQKTKRAEVIASLRQGKLSDFKNSQSLIEKIKKQKETMFVEKCTAMVEKQQNVVRRLNDENIRLMQENEDLRRERKESLLVSLEKQTQE